MMTGKSTEKKRTGKKVPGEQSPVILDNKNFIKKLEDEEITNSKPPIYKVVKKSSSSESKENRLQSISEVQEAINPSQHNLLPKVKAKSSINDPSDSSNSLKKVYTNKSYNYLRKTTSLPKKVSNASEEPKKTKQKSDLNLSRSNRSVVVNEAKPLEINLPANLSLEKSKPQHSSTTNFRWTLKSKSKTGLATEKSLSFDCLKKHTNRKIANKSSSADTKTNKNKFEASTENKTKSGKKIEVGGSKSKSGKKLKDGFHVCNVNYSLNNSSSVKVQNTTKKCLNNSYETSHSKKKSLEICYCPHIHTENYVKKICLQTSTSPTSKFNPQNFKLNCFSNPEKESLEKVGKVHLSKQILNNFVNGISEKKSLKSIPKKKAKKLNSESKHTKSLKSKATMKSTSGLKKLEKKEKAKKIDLTVKSSVDKLSTWRSEKQMRTLGKHRKIVGESKVRERRLSLARKEADKGLDVRSKKNEYEILEKLYLKLDSVEKLLKKNEGQSVFEAQDRPNAKEAPNNPDPNRSVFFYNNDKEINKRKLKHAVLTRALEWFDSGYNQKK